MQLLYFATHDNDDGSLDLCYTLVFVTDNTVSFEIRFDFNSNSDTEPKPLVKSYIIGTF